MIHKPAWSDKNVNKLICAMASPLQFHDAKLCEDEVPGAKINLNNIASYSCERLKRWLECRGLSTGGKKENLIQR